MIFFDLDGPILDVKYKYYQVYLDCAKQFGIKTLSLDEYWQKKREKQTLDQILPELSSAQLEKYSNDRKSLIEKKPYLSLDKVWPEIKEYFKNKGKTKHTLVTMRQIRENTIWELKQLEIFNNFENILVVNDTQNYTHRWQAKAEAIAKIKNVSDHSVIIGDTETDVMAGKDLGFYTVAVSMGIRLNELLESVHPDVLLSSPKRLYKWLMSEGLKYN